MTGFGAFEGVTRNPTEDIVSSLNLWDTKEYCITTQVLVCSVDSVSSFISDLHETLLAIPVCDDVILVHLGVDIKSESIKLETMGFNNMTFRVPDQAGYQPCATSIQADEAYDMSLESDLDVCKLCEQLSSCHWNVEPSADPGRFLCNYIYYRSLCLTQERREKAGNEDGRGTCHSLFIHVPPVDVVSLENQIAFLKCALQAILCSRSSTF